MFRTLIRVSVILSILETMSVYGTGMLFYNLLNDSYKGVPIILQPSTSTISRDQVIHQGRISGHIAQLLGMPNTIVRNPPTSTKIQSQQPNALSRTLSNGITKTKTLTPSAKKMHPNANTSSTMAKSSSSSGESPNSSRMLPKSNAMPPMPFVSASVMSPPTTQCRHTKCRLHHHMDTLKTLTTSHLPALSTPRRLRPKLMVYPRPIHDHNQFPIFDFTTDSTSFIT